MLYLEDRNYSFSGTEDKIKGDIEKITKALALLDDCKTGITDNFYDWGPMRYVSVEGITRDILGYLHDRLERFRGKHEN